MHTNHDEHFETHIHNSHNADNIKVRMSLIEKCLPTCVLLCHGEDRHILIFIPLGYNKRKPRRNDDSSFQGQYFRIFFYYFF